MRPTTLRPVRGNALRAVKQAAISAAVRAAEGVEVQAAAAQDDAVRVVGGNDSNGDIVKAGLFDFTTFDNFRLG